ncbi:MAG: hypothetical protein WAK16_00025 [Candidatus Cybelea sp.]|jgi:hypothetical protein
MNRHSIVAFALLALLAAGCSVSQKASDDDVLRHVIAMDDCNGQVAARQADAQLSALKRFAASPNQTPGPMPSFDTHSLRLCYVATAATASLNAKIGTHPAILALGRSCEKFIDTGSDEAMALYNKCIQDGMPAALKSGE